ncbi:MAG: hypothetical protein IPN29_14920 [Saprospiraceae bacterium]|nr:hypothetical protein [Saprospiraceae bacterium]
MNIFLIAWIAFMACGQKSENMDVNGTAAAPQAETSANYLSMKINGVEWKADHGVFGAFHPQGYNKVIIIAGDAGKKDKSEKTFNINIYNTSGPGDYHFVNGNTDLSVAQMGNWSEQDYICGSMMGFDMKVKVTKVSKLPAEVEATFSGTLTCASGPPLVITEGKFYYHE